MNKKETGTRGEAKGMPLTIKGRRVSKDYLIEHGIIKDYFAPSKEESTMKNDTISRQVAIDAFYKYPNINWTTLDVLAKINALPPAQSERLTDDDFEIIRIILSACKEHFCNQNRWEEAEEYQRIIDRFMSFASVQSEPLTDKEQRIFLAAMEREEKVCEEVDRNYVRESYEDSLMRVCKEIKRKVKDALWT